MIFAEIFYTIWPDMVAAAILPFAHALYPFIVASEAVPIPQEILSKFVSTALITSTLVAFEYFVVEILVGHFMLKKKENEQVVKNVGWVIIALVNAIVVMLLGVPLLLEAEQYSLWWYITLPGLMILPTVFIFFVAWFLPKLTKGIKRLSRKNTLFSLGFKAIFFMAFIYGLNFVLVIFIWLMIDPSGLFKGSSFFKLHAAIENTCLYDPDKVHCPQKLEDIRIIEPEEYDRVASCCQMYYEYSPADNTYVFAVRYNPTRVVVFSPLLVKEEGATFKEMRVNLVGEDRLKGAPEFLERVRFNDWDYVNN